MKKLLLAVIFLPSMYFSQSKTSLEAVNYSRGSVFDVPNLNFKAYPNIDGTPYLDENFHPIIIEGYSKALPPIRYNAFEDEMEFRNENGLNYVTKQNEIRFIYKDTGKIYILTNYDYNGKNINGYLVELFRDGKYKLYKKESIQIVENNNSTTNTYLKDKNPYFERIKDVFLIENGGHFIKISKSAKELFDTLMINHGEEISTFVKDNKINLKSEADQIKLIKYINSLNN